MIFCKKLLPIIVSARFSLKLLVSLIEKRFVPSIQSNQVFNHRSPDGADGHSCGVKSKLLQVLTPACAVYSLLCVTDNHG